MNPKYSQPIAIRSISLKLIVTLFAFSAIIFSGISSNLSADEVPKRMSDIISTPIAGKNPSEEVGPIVMSKMKTLQVLDLLRNYSGRVILPGENLPEGEYTFNSGGKLSRVDAIFAIENLLALNGVSLRKMDNGFIRAIVSTRPDRSSPPMIDHIPEDADSEQIFSKVFHLEFIDSRTAFFRVRGLLSAGNRSSIDNQPESNSLLITDSLINLKRVQEVLGYLDQPPQTRFDVFTFPVIHGSAWDLRRHLINISRTELSGRLRNIRVDVDARTNKLVIVAHHSNYDFIAELVEEFDEPVAPFTTTEVIKITQGNYWSIWRTVRGIISHQQRQFSRMRFRSEETRDDAEAMSTRIGIDGERETMSPQEGGDASEVPSAEIATAESDPGAIMVEDGPQELQFSPYIGLYADPSNNAFVVYGTKNDIERVRALLKQLDIKSPPYIDSKVFSVEFARATDIRNVIEYTIRQQQRNFARANIRSGESPGRDETVDGVGGEEEGFEYSNFVATIADNRNNTILVQGTRRDIAQIESLIQKLDIRSAPLTSNEILFLEHAEAQTLARVIQNIINFQRWTFARQRILSQAMEGGEGALPSPEIGFEFSDYAVVNADRRTNALFIYGTKADIERIRGIVMESDIAVEPLTDTKVYPLRHTDALQTSALINRVVTGQQRSLSRVRSESRQVANPAMRGQEGESAEGNDFTGITEGTEALQFSNFVSVTPDRRSNSLILYGTNSDLRQLKNLIEQVDIEVAPFTQSRVFLLENTQARSLHSVLNSVIVGQERALRQVRSSIREIRNIRPDDEEAAAAELTLESLQFSPFVTITPNDRNNSIIAYGTATDLEQLAQLVEVSDVEIAPRTQSRTYFIRHADATDVARTISTLINQQQRVRERERTLTRVFRRDADRRNNGDEAGMPVESFSDPARDQGEILSETTSTQMYNDLFSFDQDLQFSPYVSLVADNRSNSVLAYGTAFDLEQIHNLIEKIDDVLPQVRIEVVIAEVLLTGGQVSGLESFGVSYNIENPSQTQIGAQAPTLPNRADGEPSFDLGLSLNDFSLNTIFRVAREDSNVKVLSAPSVTTTHNRQATINVGEARPIITGTSSSLNNPDLVTRSTVEYRDIGITLRVRPLVSGAGFIQMDLEQIVETVIDTQTIDGNQQPIIGTRRAASFVSVRDQEVIVMGGLQQVDTREVEGSVFILGDIPLLGRLFRPKSSQQTVRELVIFIKPYIVESYIESELLTREELDRTALGPDIEYFLEEGRFEELDIQQQRQGKPTPPRRAIPEPETTSETLPPVENQQRLEPEMDTDDTATRRAGRNVRGPRR